MKDLYDVTIIGGGPTGLFTAFYSEMRGLRTKLIEHLPQLGGKVSFFYPEKWIYDVAGLPGVTGTQLIEQLQKQAESLNPTFVLGQNVKQIEKDSEGYFHLHTDQEEHMTKTVIIAAGAGIFNMRKFPLDEAEQYEGKNLHYSIRNIEKFSGKRVAVSGGGSGAVNWAMMVAKFADKVWLINKSDKFHASAEDHEKLLQSNVELKIPYTITNLIGNNDKIESLVLKDENGAVEETLSIDDFIVHHGAQMELGQLAEWDLDFDNNKIPVDAQMATNVEGVYAAGDIVQYPNKRTLIGSGFFEGQTALNSVKLYLEPSAPRQVYSTVVLGKRK
ncbi:NAD(P)/FAD-dependent oxidoreductase [Robertmurraya kyonggiensis]|uniref:NAD(P)/FAD-dependent oxidoreductase n=1 Tax=Robertmurraya kyonggiensis TaxID=1037680 RepID=UPI00130E09D5|nr:NAD(P)/FAD-dependent oxidoreductase [Robertmurraya kyonggiensis]